YSTADMSMAAGLGRGDRAILGIASRAQNARGAAPEALPMTLLCDAADSTLLIVDPQERLMPAIDDGDEVIRRCVQLATAARQLHVHVVGPEENPAAGGP